MTKRCSEVIVEVHATIERELTRLRARERRPLNLVDIGCWDGSMSERYRDILGGWARAVEIFPEQVVQARQRGIDVVAVNLETQELPWPGESADVVVANQVFEHLKNVWLAMSEVARIIVPGGYLVFSVPNLASLHNRLMLAVGVQPSSIRTFGPHIRGFTYKQAKSFLEYKRFFRVRRVAGAGFYPLPARWARGLANVWVGGSHTPVLIAQREAPARTPPPWRAMMTGFEVGEQTFYSGAEA
jgi:SAM-dependent methyltransferase